MANNVPWQIVTQDSPLYRVDGFLMNPDAIPPDTSVPFEHEMRCYEPANWQETMHQNVNRIADGGTDGGTIDGPGFDEEMRIAREEYLACKLLCETAYCNSICDREYQEKVQAIYNKYNP